MARSAVVVTVLVLSLLLESALGHGVMVRPPSRNWQAYLEKGFDYAHGLASGGAGAVSNNRSWQWPRGRKGMCGDAWNQRRWDVPGPVKAVYQVGQVITIDVAVAINHLGRFNMWICPLNARSGQRRCVRLMRADGKGQFWYLPFIRGWQGGNPGYDMPLYGDGTYSYYKMPDLNDRNGCKVQRHCNAYKDMAVYRTMWKLPDGFRCEHCKLQWQWLTGHSCWPPCPLANKDEITCTNRQMFPTCGNNGAAFPEEFFNCADVRITDAARTASAEVAEWSNSIQLTSGKWGDYRVVRMNEDVQARDAVRYRLASVEQPEQAAPTDTPPQQEPSQSAEPEPSQTALASAESDGVEGNTVMDWASMPSLLP